MRCGRARVSQIRGRGSVRPAGPRRLHEDSGQPLRGAGRDAETKGKPPRMIIHRVEQNTSDWLKLHVGIPTASGLSQLVDGDFEFRKGEMPRTYLHKKLAEKYRGQPLITLGSSGSFSTDQGMILEEEAVPWFILEYETPVDRVGFITTDDEGFGCSPDGLLVGKECGLELKA